MPLAATINTLHQLIYDYTQCAKYMCDTLKSTYTEKEELLRAYRLKLLPKSAEVEGLYYNFHGMGCYFEFEGGTIDVDFGPDGRCDGFDEYRLKSYLRDMTSEKQAYFNSIIDPKAFQQEFIYLRRLGVIYKLPENGISSHLYYLQSNESTAGRSL